MKFCCIHPRILQLITWTLVWSNLTQGLLPTTTSLSSSRATLDVSLRASNGGHHYHRHDEGRVEGVTLKLAFDSNWGVAELDDKSSERFTCGSSLDLVHKLRRSCDAVLVGKSTVEIDDCSLTIRRVPLKEGQKQPLRVILDPNLSLVVLHDPSEYQIFEDGLPTVIYHSVPGVDEQSLGLLESVSVVYMPPKFPAPSKNTQSNGYSLDPTTHKRHLPLPEVLEHLAANYNARHVMVEGGPMTAQHFLQANLVDRAMLFRAPMAFRKPYPSGMSKSTFEEAGLQCLTTETSGVDTVEYWSRTSTWPIDSR